MKRVLNSSWRTNLCGLVMLGIACWLLKMAVGAPTQLVQVFIAMAMAVATAGLGLLAAKDSKVTGGIVAATSEAVKRVPAPAERKGDVSGLPLAAAMVVFALLTLSSCALFQKNQVQGSISGDQAEISVTMPDGTVLGVMIASNGVCAKGPFISIPYFNLQCDTACGSLINNLSVELTCRTTDDPTREFPFRFGLSKDQQKAASALITTRGIVPRQDVSVTIKPVSATGSVRH